MRYAYIALIILFGGLMLAFKLQNLDTVTVSLFVAGKSPVEQIGDAKALLDAGTINADEYAKLKAKALS